MSELTIPTPGLIFGSFLFRSDLISPHFLTSLWINEFGAGPFFLELPSEKICLSPMINFYGKEMGFPHHLRRFIIMGKTLYSRETLKTAKLWAQALEEELSHKEGKRKVNLDIGLVTLENTQLATGKNFVHRVYLGDGVFSDLTYTYQKKSFHTLPWTYPDYKDPQTIEYFTLSREFLYEELKKSGLLPNWEGGLENNYN